MSTIFNHIVIRLLEGKTRSLPGLKGMIRGTKLEKGSGVLGMGFESTGSL